MGNEDMIREMSTVNN